MVACSADDRVILLRLQFTGKNVLDGEDEIRVTIDFGRVCSNDTGIRPDMNERVRRRWSVGSACDVTIYFLAIDDLVKLLCINQKAVAILNLEILTTSRVRELITL